MLFNYCSLSDTMTNSQQIFEYNEESQSERLARKSKDSPFMIIGKELINYITKLIYNPNCV